MNGNDSAETGTIDGPPKRFVYRLPEAGQLLGGITRNTVKALIKVGDLETVPIGGTQMVTHDSIVALIERGRQERKAA